MSLANQGKALLVAAAVAVIAAIVAAIVIEPPDQARKKRLDDRRRDLWQVESVVNEYWKRYRVTAVAQRASGAKVCRHPSPIRKQSSHMNTWYTLRGLLPSLRAFRNGDGELGSQSVASTSG